MQRQFPPLAACGQKKRSLREHSARRLVPRQDVPAPNLGHPSLEVYPSLEIQSASRIAIQPRPVSRSRSTSTQTSSPRALPLWELTLSLSVNTLWIAAAVGAMVRLLPVRVEQNYRIEQVETKLTALQKRVSQLQQEVERGLDASQAEAEIVARLHHIAPERMQIQILPEIPVPSPADDRPTSSPMLLAPELDATHVARRHFSTRGKLSNEPQNPATSSGTIQPSSAPSPRLSGSQPQSSLE